MEPSTSDRRQKILNAVRHFNKRIFNPMMLKLAGTTNSPFAVIKHIGRGSGKPYKTPLIAQPMGERFVFALTYGPNVDWYRNILAAGKCTLLRRGKEYHLENPVPLEQEDGLVAFPRVLRSVLRFNKVDHFFSLTIMGENQVSYVKTNITG
jgi:deazaflavin-dependent oxidoreductase (nitroreductase family)